MVRHHRVNFEQCAIPRKGALLKVHPIFLTRAGVDEKEEDCPNDFFFLVRVHPTLFVVVASTEHRMLAERVRVFEARMRRDSESSVKRSSVGALEE